MGNFRSSAVPPPPPPPPPPPQPPAGPAMKRTRDFPEPVLLPPGTTRKCVRPPETEASRKRLASAAASQSSLASGLRGMATPAPNTPNLRDDKALDQVSPIQQLTPRQQPESRRLSESTMEEGEIREYSKSSKKCEIEPCSIADYNDQASGLKKSTPTKDEAHRDNDTSVMDDTSNTATEKQETSVKQLLELLSNKRKELEASKLADSQVQGKSIREEQLPQENDKAEKQRDQITNMDASSAVEGSGISEGDIRHGKLQEVMSSTVRNEAEAPILEGFQEERQAQGSNQSQPSPGRAKSTKRQKEQVDTMEDSASSTSQGRDNRERKLQKLTSLEKNELEADFIMPKTSPAESACGTLGEVDIAISPVAQMTPSFHYETESCSLSTSCVLNWATAFGDVSSPSASYWGNDKNGVVKVGSYFVKHEHSTTLNAIIQKYGDIAKDCKNSSIIIRSYAVQGICEVVEGLRIPLQQLSYDCLETYSCFVKEAVQMGVRVEWLEERLDEVSESIVYMKEYKLFRDARKANKGKIEDLEMDIGLKEIEKRRCEEEVEELERLFKADMLEVKKKKRAINDIKSQCRAVPKRLLDGLY